MTDVTGLVREFVLFLLIALAVILVTRRLKIPYTLGLVIIGLLLSLLNVLPGLSLTPDLVLFVLLPALLFEGSWSISVRRLRKNWLYVFILAVPGLLIATLLISLVLHFIAGLSWGSAFLLGAILSPTDPVAVLGLFRQLDVNQDLSTIIEGESLFNDGVAGVLYKTFLGLVLAVVHNQTPSPGAAWLSGLTYFLLEAGGGLLIGGLCGFLISRLIRHLDDPLIETTITLITAYGVYLVADFLNVSGILAVIVAGLIFGSYGQEHFMSEETRNVVDNFWSMLAFIANALIFLLVGVQLNPIHFFSSPEASSFLLIAGLAIAIVLLSRLVMVLLLPRRASASGGLYLPAWRFTIFWSGLRGALSLALVLALPLEVPRRETLIFSTYAVVFFTLLVQGFSLRVILMRLPSVTKAAEEP